ncbi:MAG: PQQ-dependent sugar dehydrogenase [Acidobacteriota bacterium]|nr:PQQ-dependent sugar dehydrogenase [Acidobacteriota bacterium]
MILASAVLAAITFQPVVSGVQSPVAIAHAGDARMFIVQQNGIIRVYDPPALRPEPFLDIRTLVSTNASERGLLGLAFHPGYAENGLFFVDYTDQSGDTVVARYTRSATDPNRADASSARTILHIGQPFANHNGGQLQFGPDGYLYIGMGDGGSGGDPGNRAQDPADLLGKILRIDVNAEPYAIPPTNPFAGRSSARGEIWATGLRNPWRFSFDRSYGDLWIADVGQGAWEEINFQPAASIGGENYGWRKMEGTHCFTPSTNCRDASMVLPVIEYDHSEHACSVTGGYVYRGTVSRRLYANYIYGDFCNGRIWAASHDASGAVVSRLLADTNFFISTFGEDALGEIYVADYNGGQIYRIVDDEPLPPKRRSAGH